MAQGKFTASPIPSDIATKINGLIDDIAGKAASSHNHSASNITSGTLPIARGGTNATTAAAACTNLGALPTTGGTMTGEIKRDGNAIVNTGTSGSINFSGGTGLADGAVLVLRGKDQKNIEGRFELAAKNGTTDVTLQGTPAGQLTWNGQNVVRSVNSVGADSAGNVVIGTVDWANATWMTSHKGSWYLNTYYNNAGAFIAKAANVSDGSTLPLWVNYAGYADSSGGSIIASSLGTNGYVKFANGLIIQWGTTGTVPNDAATNISFSLSYSSASSYALAFAQSGATNGSKRTITYYKNYYTIQHSSWSGTYRWIAVGY